MAEHARLSLDIHAQPDDSTCGPTCLHAVYRYFGEDIALEEVIRTTPKIHAEEASRGTLGVMLGCHALARGYRVRLYSFNLLVFDPTWFPSEHEPGDPVLLRSRLAAQRDVKAVHDPKLGLATEWYIRFLEAGGNIWFRNLASRLLTSFLRRGVPILTGLSATYLYRCAREDESTDDYDDIRGVSTGHFVVLCGYHAEERTVTVADPLEDNPGFKSRRYEVPMSRLISSILLGVLTYDANMLVIEPATVGPAT